MSDEKKQTPETLREPDSDRRRLLKIAAYATPFVVTLGLPQSSQAAATHCPAACRCGGRCGHDGDGKDKKPKP